MTEKMTGTSNDHLNDTWRSDSVNVSHSDPMNLQSLRDICVNDLNDLCIRSLQTASLNQDHTPDPQLHKEHDEAGERKVDINGYLQGGRQYNMRTFVLSGRGEELFVLAPECARVFGYRDSYLLFNRNKSLHRLVAKPREKLELADLGILAYCHLTRQIAIVTARSVFQLFGHRAVKGGRRVCDDYWEAKAREQGHHGNGLEDGSQVDNARVTTSDDNFATNATGTTTLATDHPAEPYGLNDDNRLSSPASPLDQSVLPASSTDYENHSLFSQSQLYSQVYQSKTHDVAETLSAEEDEDDYVLVNFEELESPLKPT